MKDSAYRVQTTSRLAQWRIDNPSSCSYRRSDPFLMGFWNWHLVLEKNRVLLIKLYPEISNFTKQNPPIASFVIRVLSLVGADSKPLIHPEITDKQLKSNEDFVWPIDIPITGKFIIDVEFLDLKASSPQGGDPCSIWAQGLSQVTSQTSALTSLSKMLKEEIHTDITINTQDGSSLGAHRAVLAGRSPVFRSMFSHNLQEKELSTINISDMSEESCKAFLGYLYGSIEADEFTAHRLPLLRAADKYDVSDLRDACHESLVEDINADNVLERLQSATLYQLHDLRSSCLRYLVQFRKIFDIPDEFNVFLQTADRDLIADVFQEILSAWKPL